jgi:isocitrate/isopropylmalate dehydrogenase
VAGVSAPELNQVRPPGHVQVITAEKSRRTAQYAFEYALLNNRKTVTAIHKANIMKLSDGLFLRVQHLPIMACVPTCCETRFEYQAYVIDIDVINTYAVQFSDNRAFTEYKVVCCNTIGVIQAKMTDGSR